VASGAIPLLKEILDVSLYGQYQGHGQSRDGNRPSTPNAIVALVCARGGNMLADCSQSPLIGRWAGKRVLIQGDYAEDKDIPGWRGPRLSKLYRAMRPVEERKPKKDWRTTPVFTDITRDACAFLEAACNVRYFEQEQICKDGDPRSKNYGQVIDRWTTTIPCRSNRWPGTSETAALPST
jgi:hypothetical protein